MTAPIELLVYPTRGGKWRARVTGSVEGVPRTQIGPARASAERAASDALAQWRCCVPYWRTQQRNRTVSLARG